MLGYNMFAYCNNSPVSSYDPNGYYVHTYNDKLSGLGIAEGIVDAGSGGGGFVPGCGGESGRRKSDIIIQREITYVAYVCEPIQKAITNTAVAVWDAYVRSYYMQQNTQMQEAQLMLDGAIAIYTYLDETGTISATKWGVNTYNAARHGKIALAYLAAPIPTLADEYLAACHVAKAVLCLFKAGMEVFQ